MRKKFLFFGLFCLFVSLFASPQDLEEIKLIVGETKSFPAQSPTRIVIGNPEISDALSVSEKRITLVAKSKGITNFFFWDKDGEHNFRMKVIPLDIEYLNKQVKKILKYLGLSKVYTKLIEEEGRILILGSVGSENDKVKLKDALGGLAENVTDLTKIEEEVLVEISVEVLELTTGAKRELGFKWPTTVTLTEPAGRWGTLAGMPDALFRVTDWTRATFEANLDLLIKKGEARLLSRPRIVCQSGREAELLVGGEVPIITTQTVSDVGGGDSTQVEYKEYGIKLNINPQVLDKGKVQLSLKVEISEVGEAETLGDPDAPTAKAYPLTKRNVSTQLYLDDGEILAIGGLIKQKSDEDLQRFPWLADIPILGAFFRHKTTLKGGGVDKKEDTELFITLTPKILRSKKEPPSYSEEADNREDFSSYKDTDVPQGLENYVVGVQSRISNNIVYPSALLETGWQGTVVLKLDINRSGALKEVKVIKSSGYKVLDRDALRLIKTFAFPSFPAQTRLKELSLEIPIVYQPKK
ncbi:MAG: TonB family protein [Candidatus Omnitrophica bacterium]|nr:TonB family protein [Candidatus Omnitrophota bacterium]MBU2504469.1 TonB family protein [Candidatus Omnitrophota bacterium]